MLQDGGESGGAAGHPGDHAEGVQGERERGTSGGGMVEKVEVDRMLGEVERLISAERDTRQRWHKLTAYTE